MALLSMTIVVFGCCRHGCGAELLGRGKAASQSASAGATWSLPGDWKVRSLQQHGTW